MDRVSRIVRRPGVEIETYVDGSGPALVVLPSYGRDGGEDYDDITARVAQAGWQVLRLQPRGVAGSTGPMTGVTLHDLADDVAAVIRDLSGGRAVLLGHAFGHAVSRLVAINHPRQVAAVILAASQAFQGAARRGRDAVHRGRPRAPEDERLNRLRQTFLRSGHNARPWLASWHPATLRMQREAAHAVPLSADWACGHAPMLEVFGDPNPFNPQAYWQELQKQFGDRVTSVVVNDASHALFPNSCAQVERAILPFLARHT